MVAPSALAAKGAADFPGRLRSVCREADYHFYGALARVGRVRIRRSPKNVRSCIASRWRVTTSRLRSGRRTVRKTSTAAPRWSARRSRASRAANSTPSVCTSRRSDLRATNGFVQIEGLANELAARFYAARGFEECDRYLTRGPHCYQRWGADGKVRQLDQLYPAPERGTRAASPGHERSTVEQLELATVLKVLQAVSGEIVLER